MLNLFSVQCQQKSRLILDQIDSVGLLGRCKSIMIHPKILSFGVGEES